MRRYYDAGHTQPYSFRKEQLKKLKAAVLKHQSALLTALNTDLKKNPEESWITEIGFLLAEINHTLKHLKKWMQRERVKTNLFNFPSESFIYKEPLGVVFIIGPWNYPLQLLFTPLVGALSAGNCAVLKPSEFAPATAAVMKQIINEIFEARHVALAEGDGASVVPQLMNNFRFDHVFYTGSTEVGKKVYEMAAAKLVPVTLELGGKSPCVVEADANIKVAARRIAVTKFSNAGQMCVAPDYVLIHSSVKDIFVKELIATIKQFFSDDPQSDYHYGKIINERQLSRLKNYLTEGRIIWGGGYDDATHHFEPTLIEDVPLETAIMGEEIFGPILPVLTFDRFEDALAIISRNPNPLAFYIFTNSNEIQEKWLQAVHFGGGCVNNASWHLTNYNLPFGGRGNSGIGRYHGKFSFEVFSHQKPVMKTPTWFDPAVKYPPFKGKLKLLKKLVG